MRLHVPLHLIVVELVSLMKERLSLPNPINGMGLPALVCEMLFRLSWVYYVTLPSPKGRWASEQHQQYSLSPEGPALQAVVNRSTHSDNVGACLPSYSLTWTSQDGDT